MLLDAGRTRVLADEVGRQALHCIRCSACLNVCPVYSRTGGHAYGSVYPGPIGAILTPQLIGDRAAPSLPFASSLCGACYEVCPVQDRHPDRAAASARRRRCEAVGGRGERLLDEGDRLGVRRTAAVRARPAARAGSASARSCAAAASSSASRRRSRGWTTHAGPPPGRARRASATGGRSGLEHRARGHPRPRSGAVACAVARPPVRSRAPTAGRESSTGRRASSSSASGSATTAPRSAALRRRSFRRRSPRRSSREARTASASRRASRPGWRPDGLDLVDDHGPLAGRARPARRRPHRLHASRSPRPARSSSPRARRRARGRSRSSPTSTSASSTRPRSSSSCPRRSPALAELVHRERRPLTFISGPVGDLRHRAEPGRRRPRPAHPRRPRHRQEPS